MPRKHIIVSGRVQGVGFRYRVSNLAGICHLTGWVCNLDSGDVEIEIQGKIEDLDKFVVQLDKKSVFIRVDHITLEDCQEISEKGFKIRY